MVSSPTTVVESSASECETIFVDDKVIQFYNKFNILHTLQDVGEVVEVYETPAIKEDLAAWRALRKQQDEEYEESLRIDKLKVRL